MQLSLRLLASLCSVVSVAAKPKSIGFLDKGTLQPDVVAHSLSQVEEEWKDMAIAFIECNQTLSEIEDMKACARAPNAFQKSCNTVVNSVFKASNGDRDNVREYMSEVCEQSSLKGWKQDYCRSLASNVVNAMSLDAFDNRQRLTGSGICKAFWSQFQLEEKTRLDKERTEQEAAEAKAAQARAEAEKKAAEEKAAAEKKRIEQEALAAKEAKQAEEKRKEQETQARKEAEARANAKQKAATEKAAADRAAAEMKKAEQKAQKKIDEKKVEKKMEKKVEVKEAKKVDKKADSKMEKNAKKENAKEANEGAVKKEGKVTEEKKVATSPGNKATINRLINGLANKFHHAEKKAVSLHNAKTAK